VQAILSRIMLWFLCLVGLSFHECSGLAIRHALEPKEGFIGLVTRLCTRGLRPNEGGRCMALSMQRSPIVPSDHPFEVH
jgi:hypothetical protein